MVASPEKVQQTDRVIDNSEKVAVLLMGYGEVESYEARFSKGPEFSSFFI